MSLYSRRHLIAALAAAPLAGCGFTPVYGPGGTGTALRGQVHVAEPSSQAGFLLTRQMEGRLGRAPDTAPFALDLNIDLEQEGLAINTAGDIRRFNLIGRVTYGLRDTGNGAVLTSGTVENFTAYSATGTTVATLAAERDAVERLMTLMGDQITARLFATALPG